MMNKLLKKIKKEKSIQILLFGSLINLGLITLANPSSFDLLSYSIYLIITILIASIIKIKKLKSIHFAIIGIGISLLYNYGFMFFNQFYVPMIVLFYAALQQSIINYLVAKMKKVK